MNSVLNEAVEITKRFKKESEKFHVGTTCESVEYKNLVEKTDEKIRSGQICRAEAGIHAEHFIAL